MTAQVTVYYDISGVSSTQAAEAGVRASSTLSTLRRQLQGSGEETQHI